MDNVMRQHLSFTCRGACLAATLDQGDAPAGLLIVSGGNELRCGAHRGMATLAQAVAAAGYPVFRFDRRGVGDSEGENTGFLTSGPDIEAAVDAFRSHCPRLGRIVALGNCDAATALVLNAPCVDALVLTNPWLGVAITENPAASAPSVTRAYYARRIRDPRAWTSLISGAVDLRRLSQSLGRAVSRDPQSSLSGEFAAALGRIRIPVDILLARHDGTAVAFLAQWATPAFDGCRAKTTLHRLDSASHSFATDADSAALRDVLLANLEAVRARA